MVWPVTMQYARNTETREVVLTVVDYGNSENTDTHERVIMRRFYKDAKQAHDALTKPNNNFVDAMLDCYPSGGYEISDLSIVVNDSTVSLDDEYGDADDLQFTNEQLSELQHAFDLL